MYKDIGCKGDGLEFAAGGTSAQACPCPSPDTKSMRERKPEIMMEKPDALEHFRGKARYNCAQAVLKAYASPLGLGEGCIERFSQFGGGRAPEGQCGALFAAKALVHEPAAKQKIEAEFLLAAGSKTCREIRKRRGFTCEQCVQTASDLVFLRLDDGHVPRPPVECAMDNATPAETP